MSLQALQWRRLPTRAIPFGATITSSYLLDTIHDMLTGSSYYDGTARTAGVDSAWQQVTKFVTGSNTEAVYCFPPTKTIMSQSIIFSARSITGASSSAVPQVITNEGAYATDLVFGTCVKGADAAAFTQWTSLFPFGSGSVSAKYAQWFRLSLLSAGSRFTVYESREALAGVVYNPAVNSTNIILLGSIIDPEQSVTSVDAELDGRLYGVATSGVSTSGTYTVGPNFWTNNAAFLTHATTQNAASVSPPRFVVLVPQTGSILPVAVIKPSTPIVNFASTTTYSGRYVRTTMYCTNSGSFNFLGSLRDMSRITALPSNTVIKNESNGVLGYTVGSSDISASAALLLNYS
jgi:hypothetical protein